MLICSFIAFFILIVYLLMQTFESCFSCCDPYDINCKEKLPNFFESISKSQALQITEEYDNMAENCRLQINDPLFIEKLKKIKDDQKGIMQGSPWYQPLTN